jgi:hypothetical protein
MLTNHLSAPSRGWPRAGSVRSFDNHLSIEGDTATAVSEDTALRYEAYGDLDPRAPFAAVQAAKAVTDTEAAHVPIVIAHAVEQVREGSDGFHALGIRLCHRNPPTRAVACGALQRLRRIFPSSLPDAFLSVRLSVTACHTWWDHDCFA